MKNGFLKVAAATPVVRVADTKANAETHIALAQKAYCEGVRVLVFPELSLTGATCGDLFATDTLLNAAIDALKTYLDATQELDMVSVVGLPFAAHAKVYNTAAVCHAGKLLGLVTKRKTDERHFASAPDFVEEVLFAGEHVSLGTEQIFTCETMPSLTLAVEIGEDLHTLYAPSLSHSAAGATVICHPAAMPEIVGKKPALDVILAAHTARTHTAYITSLAGDGESTTDNAFGGRKLVVENGEVVATSAPFDGSELLVTELDLERVMHDRRRANLVDPGSCHSEIPFSLSVCETKLTRTINATPFFPLAPAELAAHCERVLTIAAAGLKTRITRAWAKKIVVGISGGLDSTLALLTMVRAMDALGRPRTDIVAVTMPCFGTTARTKSNATILCEELGVDFRCVDIFDAVNVHFRDIGHNPEVRDVTYENAQARERTQVLMDIANDLGGMVIGTGDLSELALGWATYNGDHMSMYGVNASIPKTLIGHVVRYCANEAKANGQDKVAAALYDILDTPVSPELLPADADGKIAQKTEDLVGPYELHDFYLYYFIRYGFTPAKLYRMAQSAWGEKYNDEVLKKWLQVFFKRFFAQQFKRSCLPDGPQVGEISLSPRGAWQMPSDAASALWLGEIEKL
jgi:NAD+ synthase (glutamine-hydrolysing)